jgi:hypothetical protein
LYESGKKSDSTQKTFVQSYLQFCEDWVIQNWKLYIINLNSIFIFLSKKLM